MNKIKTAAIASAAICLASCSMNLDMDLSMDMIFNCPDSYNPAVGDKFDEYTDNPFIKTYNSNVSTFSVDADGASYAYMRRNINNGWLPSASSVRIEEFLNYFTFDYADPTDGNNIAINSEMATCPWNEDHRLLRLGVKGKSLSPEEKPKANYVFLVDVSGSMNSSDKISLLKSGMITLLDYLSPDDRVSIITYSGSVKRLLESTLVKDSGKIKAAIAKLVASGGTAGGEALKMAYEEAKANFIEGGNNRIIMGTDGDFNVGVNNTDDLVEMVEKYAKSGIYMTVCGFGTGNLNDSMMEKISNAGNGTYQYIDSEEELTKVFVNEVGKFTSVANDTKLQVTFDSLAVSAYRLIGYENRVLSSEDFTNDDKDAGEIGAGQTITALYEIVPGRNFTDGEVCATFDARYKKSLGAQSIPLTNDIQASDSKELTCNMSFAAGVASYGMILRNSPYKGNSTFSLAIDLCQGGTDFDPFDYRKQFVQLITKAQAIDQ